MYMSGKALFPLSISVAARLAESFDGKLPMSFSGGADQKNIDQIVDCGLAGHSCNGPSQTRRI